MLNSHAVLRILTLIVSLKYFVIVNEFISDVTSSFSSTANSSMGVQLKFILENLLRIENDVQKKEETKVAVGIGSCIDVILPALKVMDKLRATQKWEEPSQVNHAHIGSIEDFYETFAYFFARGASAGRYVTDQTLFDHIYKTAQSSNPLVKLGSNAPVMARRFLKENVSVMLLSDVMTSSSTSSSSSSSNNTSGSATLNDLSGDIQIISSGVEPREVHIILEYKLGERLASLSTPRANRFILYRKSKDIPTSMFNVYYDSIVTFNPDLFVVGGRNGLENLEKLLKDLNMQTMIHAELSSFSERKKLISIITNVLSHVNSIGMNEQELPNLRQCLEIILKNPRQHLTSITSKNNSKASSSSENVNQVSLDNGKIYCDEPSNFGEKFTLVTDTRPDLEKVLMDLRAVVKLSADLHRLMGDFNQHEKDCKNCGYESRGNNDNSVSASNTEIETKKESVSMVRRTRTLSRIHFHTLAFHVVATEYSRKFNEDDQTNGMNLNEDASKFKRWRNIKSAAAKSSLTANRHTCGSETIDINNAMLIFNLNSTWTVTNSKGVKVNLTLNSYDPVTCWKERIVSKLDNMKNFQTNASFERSNPILNYIKSPNLCTTSTKFQNECFKNDTNSSANLNACINNDCTHNSSINNNYYSKNRINNNYINNNYNRNNYDEIIWEFCFVPVIVCKKVKQTVGGGDNISSAGLVPQL
ncbi:hypothetical protein HELRODRAFT_167310 [Helobdella robusta]|uniref:ADP-dependent glucokinase n=1 Tax=Helobdella robusta TaxID=6412 RepID=T1EZ89_HELRO|nr:hypothetical protein HELRODRAFT_167310 [Helobdella robusta]ESO10811.1 hypothetical protein HELRODRAFT_167310 [Helobdella robusta]